MCVSRVCWESSWEISFDTRERLSFCEKELFYYGITDMIQRKPDWRQRHQTDTDCCQSRNAQQQPSRRLNRDHQGTVPAYWSLEEMVAQDKTEGLLQLRPHQTTHCSRCLIWVSSFISIAQPAVATLFYGKIFFLAPPGTTLRTVQTPWPPWVLLLTMSIALSHWSISCWLLATGHCTMSQQTAFLNLTTSLFYSKTAFTVTASRSRL